MRLGDGSEEPCGDEIQLVALTRDSFEALGDLGLLARADVSAQRGGRQLCLETEVRLGGCGFDERTSHGTLALWSGVPAGLAVSELIPGHEVGVEVLVLYVLPEFRSLGVGECLYWHMCEWAQQMGAVRIDASALPGDRATKNFFEGHGAKARKLTMNRDL